MIPHRKRIKHYEDPSHCRELTFSCYQRLPLLTNDSWREELSHAIDRAGERHRWRLAAFVFMPEHVHLLLFPLQNAAKIDLLLKAIKRPVSWKIKQSLPVESPLRRKLTIRQRPEVETFRFWQEGPGYDRNLEHLDSVLASMDYFHMNPVRRGLCDRADRWRWSSAKHFLTDGSYKDLALPTVYRLPADFFDPM
ncbi:MAG: transposase [Planctomycetes bacterium]|nr:transposase [Planctomycetota bacterium]